MKVSLAHFYSEMRRILSRVIIDDYEWTRRDFRGSLDLRIHFEPEAPSLQGKCYTRLSYGPMIINGRMEFLFSKALIKNRR